jgi:glycosyltransferase involved in cell wall biosynthesis
MNIILNCERMKYKHTGLYSFCLHLANALIEESKEAYPELDLYIPKQRVNDVKGQRIILQKEMHKLFPLSSSLYDLWHETSQGGDYYPKSTKKKLLTIHDLNFLFDNNKNDRKKKKYLADLQKQVDNADFITTISNYSLGLIQKFLDIRDKPVKVIYNGCNFPSLSNFSQPSKIKNAESYFFTIGTIVRKKNFHVLPGLLDGINSKLVIAGEVVDKKYYNEILEEAKKQGVTDRIIFLGAVPESEKWWLYDNMTAFLFPSIAEGFGLPVIEAMSFGKPAILSKETSLPEIGGKAAYYFSSLQPGQMKADLENALVDYKLFPEKREQIIAHAKSFSWSKAAKEYWKVYAELLGFEI